MSTPTIKPSLIVPPEPSACAGPNCAESPGSVPITVYHAPCVAAWRKATRRQWAAHNKAEKRWLDVIMETPRRPWHKKRRDRAGGDYERTLLAIPPPPEAEAEAWLASLQNASAEPHRG